MRLAVAVLAAGAVPHRVSELTALSWIAFGAIAVGAGIFVYLLVDWRDNFRRGE